jgi:hypothetical protein
MTRAIPPIERARAYVAKMPGAVSGDGGHDATFSTACKIVSFGLSWDDAWTLLRDYNSRCEPMWSESQLRHKLEDAFRCVRPRPDSSSTAWFPRCDHKPKVKIDPELSVKNFLKGFQCSACDLIAASTCKIPPLICGRHFHRQGAYLIDQLFEPGELVNIVTNSIVEHDKARPADAGLTLERNEWEGRLLKSATWQAGGAWLRMNPLDGRGVADANVTAFRFALIECDVIPFDLQLPLLARLPLPIAAIVSSGGRSLHAWVRIDATDYEDFRHDVSRLLGMLADFGVDSANKNPSRMSRLPGVVRGIGAQGDGRQQLFYLNPNPKQKAIL